MATLATMNETRSRHTNFGAKSLKSTILSALAVRKQRKALRGLDDVALNDLGLTRRDALQEAAQPIWNVPSNWLR